MLSRPLKDFATPQSNRSPVPPRALSLYASSRIRSASYPSSASRETSVSYPQRFHDFDATLPHGGYSLGRLVAVELREVEPDLAGDPEDLDRLLVNEHADPDDVLRQRDGDTARLLDANATRALGENEPDGVSPCVSGHAGVTGVGYAANLYQRHAPKCTLFAQQSAISDQLPEDLLKAEG